MIVLVYGVPGAGKSTLIHDFIRAQPGHLYFVNDHEAGWGPDGLLWRGQPPEWLSIVQAGEEIPELPEGGGVVVFRGWEAEDIVEAAIAVGNVVYVDDELDLAARRKGWEVGPIRHLVHRGRHLQNSEGDFCELHLVGACRRPQNLHTDITDLADQIFVFRVQGSRTLQRLLADSTIEDGDWERIRTLPKFHFRHWPSGDWGSVAPVGNAAPLQEEPELDADEDELEEPDDSLEREEDVDFDDEP